MDNYLTVNEVSEQLRCSRLTVTRWIKSKKLRAFKLAGGRTWRISRNDFEKFIKKGRTV